MFKSRKITQAAALLLVLVLILLVSPTAAQGPQKNTNLQEAAERITVISSYSVEVDKSSRGDSVESSAEPGAAPLLEGPTAGQAESQPQSQPQTQTVNESLFEVAGNGEKVSIIVQLDGDSLASAVGGGNKIDPNSAASQQLLGQLAAQQDSFAAALSQVAPAAQIVHRYRAGFNGVSMIVSSDQVSAIAALPGVKAVYPDQLLPLHTETSPSFIGANRLWNELGGNDEAGEGVIIGILDTGIWPEHPSFAEPDPQGNLYPAPPKGTGGYGCEFGSVTPGDEPFSCNNKLIGAYRFMATYELFGPGLLPTEFLSARDDDGHGTHTASTSGGNYGVDTVLLGMPRGKISGIAPRAHIIGYKVCGNEGCYASDSAAAIDQAIFDGVDVVNFSIGGGATPYNDTSELAFLDAYNAGVFVAASAGNSGPGSDTTDHRGPWVTTVAASTTNRHFLSTVILTADNGDRLRLVGATVTEGTDGDMPVVYSPDPQCNPQPAGTFNGELVICDRGIFARVTKSFNAMEAGAGAMILRNLVPQGLNTDNHYIPSVHLDAAEGSELGEFMDTHTGVVARFRDGRARRVQGDVIASFSSRGGPAQTLGVNKPDVTAPGVQILAGNSPLGALHGPGGFGPFGELFQAIQGTSMSSPHVAGAAALLTDLHPDWTPGQIKSALMLTARTRNVVKEDGETPANAYDYGAGRIDLRVAGDPGITIDETAENYVILQDELWNANYPSVYHPNMPGKLNVQRTIQSVISSNNTWKLRSETDQNDWHISMVNDVKVRAGETATFDIHIDASAVPVGEVRHGAVLLSDSSRKLHIPVSFVRGEAAVAIDKVCEPVNFARNSGTTSCTVIVENTTFGDANFALTDVIPDNLQVVPSSVSGADLNGNTLSASGVLSPAQPPVVNVAIDPLASPAGYLSIAGFGGTLDVGATDETIANVGVPAFEYAGASYGTIGIVSNGYVVVGGGTGADVNFINSDLPDATPPNNVLAPFWTDLNPDFGGRVLVNTLTDGVDSWIVVEWESVQNYGDGETNTFQIWISYTQPDDISFTYGTDISDGDGGFLTVGAENSFGNSGGTIYFDGVGTPPAPSFPAGDFEVDVFSTPGAGGGSHTMTFNLFSSNRGAWINCAEVTSDVFQGVAVDCASGLVE